MKELAPLLLALLTFTAATAPAAERPHIILIMVDDMGFSDIGYHGSEIDTPNLDALAHGGVRFSQFHNSGRCCPTRASLITGLHPHQTGIGWMTQSPESNRGASEPPAYQGHINHQCVTIAEVLGDQGYATLMAGKWHLGYHDTSHWPLQRGFEKFFGCISGATRFFHPEHPRGMTFGNENIDTPESTTGEAFYATDAYTDYAIRFLKEEQENQNRPTFLYLAYTAPHWPLQAFEDDIAKYRGKYKIGWDKLREQRFQKQKDLGLLSQETLLSPRTSTIPEWQSLDEHERDEMDLKMAVYAAMIDRVDQNIGKLIAFLKESGTYENTLILFLSDNGACQEGGILGRGEFNDVQKRNQESDNSYGEAWANAGSTPFRLYKHFTHEGGTATPFFMHWPAAIKPRPDWFTDPAQLIDIMPTLVDVAGAHYPQEFHNHDIHPPDGISLRPAFDGKALDRREPIFIEHETNASIRDGDWKLVGHEVATQQGTNPAQWELYNMASDRTETLNLAAAMPEKVEELAAQWEQWAHRVKVYPRGKNSPTPPAPKAEPKPPLVQGRAFAVNATIQADQPHGTAISHGGNQFGYALNFVKGRPAFLVRNQGKLTRLVAKEPVSGKVTITATLDEKQLSLRVNGSQVASMESPGLLTQQPGLGLYLGLDFRDPIGDYNAPNPFNGQLLSHRIDLASPKVTMRTPWAKTATPENAWNEYPRPMMQRKNWTNLNGLWDYAVTDNQTDNSSPPQQWDGQILVPFAIESPLSGVEQLFLPEDTLWYRRTFDIAPQDDRRYRLNFEAVDYQSTLWVNGNKIGSHTGGNLPFSFDITHAVEDGPNIVTLRVTDATDTAYQLHGKQRLNPNGIWYTPVSGIWQTVWLEEVPELHITGLKITPKTNGLVTIHLDFKKSSATSTTKITAFLKGTEVGSATSQGIEPGEPMALEIPNPQLWSPDSPTLYDLQIQLGDDTVQSYVGLRETGREQDAQGHWRFTLNGKPVFHWGTLDQGWWPDGLLTPPCDDAMRSDIEFLKAAGFNTIRKHIKVEPRRYYYHCDQIGMLVWQDQVSADPSPRVEWSRLAPHPPRAQWPPDAHKQFMAELKQMIDHLHNHPSIVQWVPFNERWGQHQTMEVGEWTVAYDPTRDINIASGGNFYPVGHIVDAHNYPHPAFPFHHDGDGRFDDFVKVVGEFGGHGFPLEGHVWSQNTRNWGYGGIPKDKNEWLQRYRESIRLLAELKQQGIAAGIYTQTTDVEGEINGLVTYDRQVQKIAPEELKKIAAPLFE